MHTNFIFILFIIFLAFIFDFTNGFHDAANSIATIVTTGVLKPWQAVIWAAFFNFIAFFIFKLAVAHTVGTGLIRANVVNSHLIFATLISAIIWNIITWYYGMPSSSTHALVGGLAGAAIAKGGFQALEVVGFLKVIIAIFISPVLGILLGICLTALVTRLTKRQSKKANTRWFKGAQLISSALLSITHGGNDAQKTMGLITVLLYSNSLLGPVFYVPFWVVFCSYTIIALGNLSGGWRIVQTMGKKITHITPMLGCCAETSAAAVIFIATQLGLPISTTQTVTGSIAGVGLSNGFWNTKWKVMNKIFLVWILVIPITALIAGGIMFI